jgi:hypothetical protein
MILLFIHVVIVYISGMAYVIAVPLATDTAMVAALPPQEA